jgi:hypothetical protein
MPESRRVVKIFLASPGDLADERLAARDVVQETNQQIATSLGYQLELVGWEDTVSRFGRPQEIINRELDQCELFVGLMWRRWGTPPNSDGTFSSGFEEEYFTVVRKRESAGTPEISLLFKDISQEFLVDPGEDLRKVIAFKKGVEASRKVLYQPFSDLRDFEKKFRSCVMQHLRALRATEAVGSPESARTQAEAQSTSASQEELVQPKGLLSISSSAFLRGFIAQAEVAKSNTELSAIDVARLRLFSAVIAGSANDDLTLGTHDANLMYAAKDALELSSMEISGLVDSGLRRLSSETVPLWHWLFEVEAPYDMLAYRVVYSTSNEIRQNALKVMTKGGMQFPSDIFLGRESVRNTVLGPDSEAPASVKVAALEYFSELGTLDDIPAIESEFAKNSSQTANAAANAIVKIALRVGPAEALEAILRLQSADVGDVAVAGVFAKDANLDHQNVIASLKHRSIDVRLAAFNWMDEKNILSEFLCEELLGDTDVRVRYRAMSWMSSKGRAFSSDDAKRLLSASTRKSGILGMFNSTTETVYQTRFANYQLHLRAEDELDALESSEFPVDREAYLVRADKYFAKHGDELRAAVRDRFSRDFDSGLESKERVGVISEEYLKKALELKSFVCREHTRKALEIISNKREPRDLDLIRDIITDGKDEIPLQVVEYLGKLGAWSDVALLAASEDRIYRPSSLSLLDASFDKEKNAALAKAYMELGRGRFEELLQTIKSPGVKRIVLAKSTKTAFARLPVETLEGLLVSEQDALRRAAAIQCARCLSRRRLNAIAKRYLRRETYYYNVVHWLDLGLSASVEIRNRVLDGELRADQPF